MLLRSSSDKISRKSGAKPVLKPTNPCFSSGPCAKRPGWSLSALSGVLVGRSHRSQAGREKLAQAIALTRAVLCPPEDYLIAIVPASDTGAVEMALWSLLGPRPVDVAVWESFTSDWAKDIVEQLKLTNTRIFQASYGALPDFSEINFNHDFVFAWNGTTSGVRIPNANFIPVEREGLTICDATSAAFAQLLDFTKLDVVTFSWQKVLGGEAAHGVIILSPRALTRLETHQPAWPLPKIFRLTVNGSVNAEIFKGQTINTPSLLAVEDYIDTLSWAQHIGGLPILIARTDENAKVIEEWVEKTPWVEFLAKDSDTRSNSAVCLQFSSLSQLETETQRRDCVKRMVEMIEAEGAGYDFGAYRAAPPGFRIWCGATVESADVAALLPWLDWAYNLALEEYSAC